MASLSGISASSVLLSYETNQNRLQQDDAALSSGLNSVESNPSGSSIAALLQTEVDSATQGAANDTTAVDALNVADGAAQGTESILQQLNSLAVQASSDLLTPGERSDITVQANQLVQQINTNATQTSFNGSAVLQGQSFTVQSGISEGSVTNAQTPISDAAQLGVSNLDFSTTAGAQQAETSIQNAIAQFSTQQAQLGAQEVTINEDIDNSNTLATNLQASESSIADTNVEQTVTDANQANVQSQADLSLIAAIDRENSTLAGIFVNSLA